MIKFKEKPEVHVFEENQGPYGIAVASITTANAAECFK